MFELFFSSAGTYISDRLLPIILSTALVLALRWLLIFRGRLRRRSKAHEAGVAVLALYASVVLSLTFLPIIPGFGGFEFSSTLLQILRGEYAAGAWVYTMLLSNVLMFVPLGFLIPLLWSRFRWFEVLAVGLACILCVEVLQPFVGRSFDIDDVVLNFLGVAAGLLLSAVPRALFPRAVSALRS